MFLLNKVTSSRRGSRELHPEECTPQGNHHMEYNHAFLYGVPQGQERPKTRDRRPSLRMRTSFFGGGKRRSWDSDESFDNSSPTRTPTEELEPENISHNRRRGLKKMSSKSSLSSIASFSTNSEGSTEKKSKARLWQEALFRSKPSNQQQPRSTPPIVQVSPAKPKDISGPFNFTHLHTTHQEDASKLRTDEIPQDLGQEWNRALQRESQSRPSTARTYLSTHWRSDSMENYRSRSNSARSLVHIEPIAEDESPQEESENNDGHLAVPVSAPPRRKSLPRNRLHYPSHSPSPSLHVPSETEEEPTKQRSSEESVHSQPHAVTTPDNTCYGQKSAGVVKFHSPQNSIENIPKTPLRAETENIPIIRETQSTPEVTEAPDAGFRHQLLLTVRTSRPLSQISQLSDTLNGNFQVPASPTAVTKRASMRAKRISKNRFSALLKLQGNGVIDSWEEDIDWVYENEEEAFDFSSSDDEEPESTTPDRSPSPTEAAEPESRPVSPVVELETSVFEIQPKFELLGIPEDIEAEEEEEEEVVEEKKEPEMLNEKRITGIFEDHLLLPPSPRYTPSSFGFSNSRRAQAPRDRDSGFESGNENLLMRAGNNAVRHRSSSLSPALPNLKPPPRRSYREELCRVARQLDDHIASLNRDFYPPGSPVAPTPKPILSPLATTPVISPSMSPTSKSPTSRSPTSRSPTSKSPVSKSPASNFAPSPVENPSPVVPVITTSITETIKTFTGNRPRADSQATCVTLCSDTDTITPIETNEAITPSNSAHNSVHFVKTRAMSVTGAGFAVEGRLDKGLSFPAASIPGVVELAPDMAHMGPNEPEFVHYI